jgi:hypothetical protein
MATKWGNPMTTINDVTSIGDAVHFFQWVKTRRDLGGITIRTVDGHIVSGELAHATKDLVIVGGDKAKPGAPIKATLVFMNAIASVEMDASGKA